MKQVWSMHEPIPEAILVARELNILDRVGDGGGGKERGGG